MDAILGESKFRIYPIRELKVFWGAEEKESTRIFLTNKKASLHTLM